MQNHVSLQYDILYLINITQTQPMCLACEGARKERMVQRPTKAEGKPKHEIRSQLEGSSIIKEMEDYANLPITQKGKKILKNEFGNKKKYT